MLRIYTGIAAQKCFGKRFQLRAPFIEVFLQRWAVQFLVPKISGRIAGAGHAAVATIDKGKCDTGEVRAGSSLQSRRIERKLRMHRARRVPMPRPMRDWLPVL